MKDMPSRNERQSLSPFYVTLAKLFLILGIVENREPKWTGEWKAIKKYKTVLVTERERRQDFWYLKKLYHGTI